MPSRKTEFLAKIKPILDKSDVRKDAEEYARELQDVISDVKFGFDEDSLKELGEALNEELTKKGRQPLVFSDIKIDNNVFKNVATRFAQAISEGMAQGVSDGVSSGFNSKQAIANLAQERKVIEDEIKSLRRKEKLVQRAIDISRVVETGMDDIDEEDRKKDAEKYGINPQRKIDHAYQWTDKNNMDSIRKQIKVEKDKLQEALSAFMNLKFDFEETGQRDIEAWDNQILEAIEHIGTLRDMWESIYNMGPRERMAVKDILDAEIVSNLGALDEDGEESVVDEIYDLLDRVGKSSVPISQQISVKTSELEQIVSEIQNIENQTDRTRISVEELDDALKRIRKDGAKKPIPQPAINQASAVLEQAENPELLNDPKINFKSTLQKYNDAQASGDIIAQYKALLQFTTLYEKSLNQGIVKPEYADTYQQLSKDINIAKESLQAFIEKANEINASKSTSKKSVVSDLVGDSVSQSAYDAEKARADKAEKELVETKKQNEKLEDKLNDIRSKFNQDASSPKEKPQPKEDETQARKEELIKQLNAYGDNVSTSEEAEVNIQKRAEIFEQLKKENLITEEIQNNYDETNQKLKEKLELLQKSAETSTKISNSLEEHLSLATKQQMKVVQGDSDANLKESMRLVGGEGVLSSVQGKDLAVDLNTMVNQLLKNLKDNIIMSLHDHPNGLDMFTPEDVKTFANLYYGQGVKINGIIANGIIKTIDFSGISQEVAKKIALSFSKNVLEVSQQSDLFDYEDGDIIPNARIENLKTSDPSKYEEAVDLIRDVVDAALNKAFEDNGVESTLKGFTKSQLPELSQYLLEIQKSGESAVSPVEKLKNIFATIRPNQKFDWSNYSDIFERFENGSISAIKAANQISERISLLKKEAQQLDDGAITPKEVPPATTDSVNEEVKQNQALAATYDELKEKLEAYYLVKRKITDAMDNGEQPFDLFPELKATEGNILQHFSETDADSSNIRDDISRRLQDSDMAPMLEHICNILGVEIPQAAEKAEGAIEEVVDTQEKLNAAEAQNPPVQDNSEIHNTNTEAINKEADATERLNEVKKGQSYSGEIYHGSATSMSNETYDVSKGKGKRNLGDGLYFTPDIELAKKHGANILRKNVNLDNVFTFTEEFITDIDALYRAMGQVKPANADWAKIKRDVFEFTQDKNNQPIFAKNMRDMGYQAMHSKGYGYADPNAEQLVIYDESYYQNLTTESYNAIIEGASQATSTVDNLNESLKETNNLAQTPVADGTDTNIGGASVEELNAANEKAQQLQEQLAQKDKELAGKAEENAQIQAESNAKIEALQSDLNVANARIRIAQDGEEIAAERARIAEANLVDVQYDNDNLRDQNRILAEQATVAEKESSDKDVIIQNLKAQLDKVQTAPQNQGESQGLGVTEDRLRAVLQDVFTNILNPKTQQNDGPEKAPWALEDTLSGVINTTLGKIVANTEGLVETIKANKVNVPEVDLSSVVEAIKHIDIQPTPVTDVGHVLATENTLGVIRQHVESIDSKVKNGVVAQTNQGASKNADDNNISLTNKESQTAVISNNVGGNNPSSDIDSKLTEQIKTAVSALLKYKTTLQEANQLSGILETGIDSLAMELEQVSSRDMLTIWNEHFKQFKNGSSIIQTLTKDYQTLGAMQASAAVETDPTKLAHYLDDIQTLQDRIAIKSVDVNVNDNRFEDVRQRAYNITRQELQQKSELIEATKRAKEEESARKKAQKELDDAFKKQVKEAQRDAGINAATSLANAGQNTVRNAIGNIGITSEFEKKAEDLSKQVEELRNLRDIIQAKGVDVDEQDQKTLSQRINQVKTLKEEMDAYLAIHNKYSGDNAKELQGDASSFGGLDVKAYEQQLTQIIMKEHGYRATIKGFNADTGELNYTVKEGANTFAEYSAAVDVTEGKIKSLRTGTKKTETFLDSIKRKTRELGTYLIGSISVYDVINQVKKGITYVREIDSALTELKKVTDETEESYNRFLDTASKTADKVGSTIKEIVSSTADWSRLGYSMQEAAKLAESTSVLLNVSEFQSIDEATSALTSTLQAFGYTASQSMKVVDVLNEVGKLIAHR